MRLTSWGKVAIVGLAPILGALLLAPAASASAGQLCSPTLNPPPLSFETCQTVGGGTIASGSRVVSDALADTGFSCGAFDIFNQDTFDQHATRWYDQNGDLARRHIYDHFTFGQWSNPMTGAIVPYTQTTVENDVFAIPGELTSETATFTGENVWRAGPGAPVLFGNGRSVLNFDGSVLYESSGRNDINLFIFENDPAAFDQICAALAG
jgi:hypothetical protein